MISKNRRINRLFIKDMNTYLEIKVCIKHLAANVAAKSFNSPVYFNMLV
jgi:hypothetical protein